MKGHILVTVFPHCRVHNQSQEFALFACALALKLFARDTGKPHHVEPRAEIGCCRLMLPDLRSEGILSRPNILRLAVVLLRSDPTIQLVFVHRIQTALTPVAFILPGLRCLLARPFLVVR